MSSGKNREISLALSPSGTIFVASAIRMSLFANFLQGYLQERVVDKTNLDGLFDMRVPLTDQGAAPPSVPNDTSRGGALDATPAASTPSGNPIFAALQDELGLRLDLTKAPLQIVVIDSVLRPSEN
jgi:uncharacterized protein (TIGR03435 family)